MAISAIYLKEGASHTVEYGRRVAATDLYQVKDISVSTNNIATVVDTVLNSTVIPADGASYSSLDPDLKVVRRRVFDFERIPNDESGQLYTCKVQVDFELFRPEDEATFPISGNVSLSSVEKFKDRTNNQITATFGGTTIGGSISVLEPRISEVIALTKQTDTPSAFAQSYVGKVNNADWRGQLRGLWLVMSCSWRLMTERPAPPIYEFTFEIEFNPDPYGWQYAFVFTDSDGNVPNGADIGNGISLYDWHPEADFSIFGA